MEVPIVISFVKIEVDADDLEDLGGEVADAGIDDPAVERGRVRARPNGASWPPLAGLSTTTPRLADDRARTAVGAS